ncbi:hypothetical protein POPTR_014G024000v4 [Populus trichocarpa]|uniref:Transcription factor MYC/MYB N-terminal domain-containing protein n=2 Tax=Populus trichocarpa TaxID=3694 RepID=U5FTP2_POPTR|nr:uncharacterized protein LOC18104847 isoform X1 [Populus trichocarpa]KAI5563827.1 hypothetical protein BDE02_14G018200 [Populus trichocarpa]PNT02618.1 hypothetical protein POPTR_014G024000v4 [Populus trichocarpa]|eukprot:XP_006374885.1 uncharacterized protein LOC18104847 isoform X1 [Populus trichocarpa]
MEGGLPMLNCLLQHTLRSLCSCTDSSNPSKWVYAVFWRILPRNYPPPKWDYGGTALDRSKGNKRNWILVWEDGFCDVYECERAGTGYMKGRFGTDVFFKMSHEVYNYGEGLVGKVAADNSHKWVFKENPNESDPNLISSWNMSIEPQPRAWEFQFNSGIQTIAIISVREGVIQLGSFDKIVEDLNLVISIQRKFSYLQSIPGIFAIQRPYLPIQHPYITKPNTHTIENQEIAFSVDDKRQITGVKRLFHESLDDFPIKAINMGWNSPQNGIPGPPIWSIPPLLPTMSCSLGALLSKLPSATPSYSNIEALGTSLLNNNNNNRTSISQRVRVDDLGVTREGQLVSSGHLDAAREEKPTSIKPSLNLPDKVVGFGHVREGESALSLN